MSDILYDKEMECRYCGRKFKTKKTRISKISVSKKDSDFCIHYTNKENPYYYEVWVCPHCSFAFNANFSELKPAHKELINKEYIKRAGKIDLCGPRTMDEAIRAYKLTLLCASVSGQNSTTIAGLCLRIAWLYRFQAVKEEEVKYLVKAVHNFQEVYEHDDLTQNPLGEHKILYLLGELNGRLGNYSETRRWFNLLLSQRNIEPAINHLVRDQWAEYKTSLT